MPYFDEAFLTFFKELAQNNHKEWFQAHKPTYENKVKGPFYALVGEMIEKIHREDPRIHPEVKNSVFRINRDIRFWCTRRILVFSSLLQATLPAQNRRPKIAGPLHPHDRILDLGYHSGSFPGSATCGLVGACRLIIKQSACGMALRGFDLIVEVLATRLVRIHRVSVRMS